MGKQRRYTPRQIINKLREAEALIGQGKTIGDGCTSVGCNRANHYRWRNEYGGMKTTQARKLKELEHENAPLKKVVAVLTLDKLILKEAAEGNF